MAEHDSAYFDADAFPGVSIIIPVYNDQDHVSALLESLLAQDYPKDRTEIMVVDNNSTDSSRDIIQRYPVRFLEEKDIQSSYAARNRGIRAAAHEILAFIDSDCTAVPSWLTEGIRVLRAEHADLAGGKVEFTFASDPSSAELYDSLMHFNFEKTIAEKKGTGAGNLFARKRTFDRLGLFPAVRSGGDFQWSRRAMENGMKVVFAPGAVVRHPARRLREILQKQIRTGAGYPYQRLAGGHSRLHEFFYLPARCICTAVPVRRIRRDIENDGRAILKKRFWRIVWTAWICIIVYRLSAWIEWMKILCGRRNPDDQ